LAICRKNNRLQYHIIIHIIMKNRLTKLVVALCAGLCCLPMMPVTAQTVQKVADLTTGQDINGNGSGASVPECHFTLVGTNLWFTSNAGGAAGAGGIFSLDLSDSNIIQLATFDNSTGTKPQASSIMVADGKGRFTTSAGGTGAKGTLCSIDLTNYGLTVAFNFPTNADFGWSPHSTPVQIGDDLWFTTSSGGLPPDGNTVYGAIVKYSLTGQTLTNVFSLDSTNSGRQPLGNSLIKAGNAYYCLAFAGGTNIVAGSTPNGSGVLGKLSFDNFNQPVLTKVLDLPGGFASFPGGDVAYDQTNFLYFTTAGVSTNPGAIVRFDIANNVSTNLFVFYTNAVAVTNFGKQPYGTPVLYNNALYFTTLAGGTVGKGVLDELNLAGNSVTKLADFEGATGLALGASPQYGGGTIYTDPVTTRNFIYFPINRGGLNNNNGTIIRMALAPLPIIVSLQNGGSGNLILSWTGGYPPFGVDTRQSLADDSWQTNWLGGLNTNSIILSASNSASFFRVEGAGQ
jgi:uncharacterized repeat protein (TIGR03803 family)